MEENKIKSAQEVFDTICALFDEHGWKGKKLPARYMIHCGEQGDSLPVAIMLKVNVDLEIVTLLSPMPFIVPLRKRDGLAVAVSRANMNIVDGAFNYNYLNGKILFGLTTWYAACRPGKDTFEHMISAASAAVCKYRGKFFTLTKREMSMDEIVRFIA